MRFVIIIFENGILLALIPGDGTRANLLALLRVARDDGHVQPIAEAKPERDRAAPRVLAERRVPPAERARRGEARATEAPRARAYPNQGRHRRAELQGNHWLSCAHYAIANATRGFTLA